MSKEPDEEDEALRLSSDDPKKMRPPNKKKFGEDMDGLTSQIREKEAEHERTRQAVAEIKHLKAERMEFVNKRKQIVIDLEKINKEIPDRMKRLNEIEASLYYKSEERINSAIQRLEWNLRVKTYKLTEEKKIVSEIDSLKRSKKNLVQYVALRQEISGIRDKQKSMRDERDRCTKEFNRLKAREEELRQQNRSLAAIKKDIDLLYDQRRQTNANFKQQRGEFHELKEKQKKESWKKKSEERKAHEEEKRREQAEIDAERLPHESDLHLCITLTSYLNRLLPSLVDTSQESLSPSSSQDDPEPLEEMEDGHYKLLRKSDDVDSSEYSQGGMRRLSKRNKRIKKLSMDKRIAHPSDVLNQFMSLNLMAPTCLFEVPDVLEQLEKKQRFFEKEQQLCEATSDAGISATESAVCAMSRQASKTESCEGVQESTCKPDDSVYTALFQQQDRGSSSLFKDEELCGAVGGNVEEDWSSVVVGIGSDTPNSDSTIEGDTGSGDSQKLVRPAGKDSIEEEEKSMKSSSHDKRELKRSLAIVVSESMDRPYVIERQSQISSVDDFPSLLESSQSSFMSDVSFPSLGASSSLSPRQEKNMSTFSSLGHHPPLTKTTSLTPGDSRNNQAQNPKSYASSVVGRTRSFSEAMTRKPNNIGSVSGGALSKSGHLVPASKQLQPPTSLSLAPSTPMNNQPSPSPSSSKPRPSIHRSRTLTPTLTRSWAEVRGKDRRSAAGSGDSITKDGGKDISAARTPTKPQVTPSLSASSLPIQHKPSLSPRLSYPLQSKPSLAPKQPIILIDDEKNFPPLCPASGLPRRNSTLSTKSSSGSTSILDHSHGGNNNNNNNNNSPAQLPLSYSSKLPTTSNLSSGHHIPLLSSDCDARNSGGVKTLSSKPDIDSDLSAIPKGDKSSTEKWVESSMAFVQDLATSRVDEDPDIEVTSL